ncbi:colicin-lik bacteriocin with DNase/tRNase domain [Archangium gephyra]|uniref:Colicin-lik bacteriocin with DNase/tRNase domain n=1 Tax=Archangium gephyra TaxID=48 RepID=A0ABX9JP10_9BACT|nr:HNH endonuclease [Archangium gephyra]REG23325.1 colicin-lik bacteriocin with DNase/tRNase domain [Archangium gephyra]
MSQVAGRLLVASLLLAACATDGTPVAGSVPGTARGPHSRVQVRLETEEGPLRTFVPPRAMPVKVTPEQFDSAMARLVAGLELPSPSRHRLALTACGQSGQEEAGTALTRGYQFWCERRGTPGDCLSLLGNMPSLGAEARRTLALTIALGSVWEGSVDVWASMVDPVALQSMVMSAMAGYLAMLAFPNPVTQAAAVSFGCLMVAWLGVDTVWSLLQGWRQLELETQQARTFAEVREAGERFGRVMGAQVGRLLVMLATAALGSTTNLLMKGPRLPGHAQASLMARTQLSLELAAVGQVRQVLVGQGSITLTLAPGALAMASQGTDGGGQAPSKYHPPTIESWRKPRFTEDGKILPYQGTRNPPTPITNLGRNRAGQSITDGKHTIRFDKDGFPEFHSRFETILDDVHIGSGKSSAHQRAANTNMYRAIERAPNLAKELGLSQSDVSKLLKSDLPPSRYTWHHHQDVGRMQLVLREEHRLATPNTGGMAIWGGGYSP